MKKEYQIVYVSKDFHKKLKKDSKQKKIPITHLLEMYYKPKWNTN